MAHLGDGSAHKVVDLVSDSDSDSLPDLDLNWFDAQEFGQDFPDLDDPLADFRERSGTHERETIDLTAIPDMDVPPSDLPIASDEDAEPTAGASGWDEAARLITEAACLQMVLGVLPDISIDHVLKIISEKTTDATRTVAQCEQVITELLDGEAYPKEADELRHKKRKREDDNDWGDYEKGERSFEIDNYEQQA
jgi:TRIAD3 protein (E3 ubiquitin-protein ligase RNF216)